MPEINGASLPAGAGAGGPIRGEGASGAPPPATPESAAGFKAKLAAKLAAHRARQGVPPEHVADLIRLFNDRGEAFESAKLVTRYPITEKDEALYEVRTDRGTRQVIRGRDGSQTVFE